MFAQFEQDVRIKANPAGVVGMCNSMHAEIKRAAMYNDALKPMDDFIKEMKGQYQTSMGLGSSFARDYSIQRNRRGRRRRGQASYRSRFVGQNFSGGLGTDSHSAFGSPQPLRGNTGPARGTAPCYDYMAGNCTRGRSCRFAH